MNALLLLLAAALPTFREFQDGARVAPDPAFQAAIRAVVHARDAEDRRSSLEALRDLAGPEGVLLVPQLFHYTLRADTTRDAMAFGVLVEHMALSRDAVVRGTIPFLEGADQERAHAAGVLAHFEEAEPDRPPSFTVYRPFLEEPLRAGLTPPAGLTRHLFSSDAGQALLVFLRIAVEDSDARKPVLWAQHVLEDLAWRERHGFPTDEVRREVETQLAFLVEHDAWWARLAALHWMREHPGFARAEWRSRLEADPHALVRAEAARDAKRREPERR